MDSMAALSLMVTEAKYAYARFGENRGTSTRVALEFVAKISSCSRLIAAQAFGVSAGPAVDVDVLVTSVSV